MSTQMLPGELTQYLHTHIPLSQAMGVSVSGIEADAVTLQAPLLPNINHRHSVFGGSAAALAMLAGWALLHVRLEADEIGGRVVIQRSTMEYLHPILGSFSARAMLEHPQRWELFTGTLVRKGRARTAVSAALEQVGPMDPTRRTAALFTGQFVATRR